MLPTLAGLRVSVIGLGYVGLPLAVHFGRRFPVVGFDISQRRIDELRRGVDHTREVAEEEMAQAAHLSFSSKMGDLAGNNFHIVTVPTPIDAARRPDLAALTSASETVARILSPGGVVVYESTVYPGATEEVCVPIIEKTSGLKLNRDFYVGYSPERINPGDQKRRLPDILKITAGSSPESADLIDQAYAAIVTAGTRKVSSIRVAEAAKVIENVQRDVNIALVNELAQLFSKMGLETREVLEAAGTKWNFHPYQPGLVGGHCIGVDPYYLTHKAQSIGFHPEMILAGRRINDGMAAFVARDIIKAVAKRGLRLDTARILVMGFTFKENCPDTRNTKVADLVAELREFAPSVTIYDPLADPGEAEREYGVGVETELPAGPFEAVVLAVRHDAIAGLGSRRLRGLLAPDGLLYDLKAVLPLAESDARI
jgi:UDP-N-acetyl-D-galactosamine dehydrogenase